MSKKKNPIWLTVILCLAFVGVAGFGGYNLYLEMLPEPWYVQAWHKAANICLFWK